MIRFLTGIRFLRILVVELSQSSPKMLDKRYRLSGRVLIVLSFYQIVETGFVEGLVWNLTGLEDLAVLNCFDLIELLRGLHFHVFVQFNIFSPVGRFRRLWRLRAFLSVSIEPLQERDMKDVVDAPAFGQI